jgi:peptidoglycan/LPS O-acetylase OafA/YrhL
VVGSRTDLLTVQALRAIAALLVVVYHGIGAWGPKVVGRDADQLWENASAGVDIFFVISGLVMAISARRVAGLQWAGLTFLRDRLVRILPLYWLMTTIKILAVLALPALVARTELNWPYVVQSYALLPLSDANGEFFPVLPVGWTLSYEMLFYLLVALALAMRVSILYVTAPALVLVAVLAVLGQASNTVVSAFPLIFFANTIVLEFLGGVLIGLAVMRGLALSPPLAWLMLIGGFILLLVWPAGSALLRPLNWGIPATTLVLGAVALERKLAPWLPHWLLASGDASYAIYLTHGFVVPVVFLSVEHADLGPVMSLAITVLGSLIGSAMVGYITHKLIERPMLQVMRRRRSLAAMAG